MNERDLGAWILPQPKNKHHWVRIPKHPGARTIPFGYKECEDDPAMLDPIPFELEALEKAKIHLKQYSLAQVSNWLYKTTGREITRDGLRKRIQNEQTRRRKAAYYRNIAKRLHQALLKAKEYERALGEEGDESIFDRERYVSIDARAREYLDSVCDE